MVNTEIYLGSGASLTLVPETDFYIDPQGSISNGATSVQLDTNLGHFKLVKDLYIGCDLELYDSSNNLLSRHRVSSNSKYVIDGVELGTISHGGSGGYTELLLKQPKRPPIPEDAVVLADYMLMADYIPQADAEDTEISKGLRLVGSSRDIKYDGAIHGSHLVTALSVGYLSGLHTGVSPSSGGTPLTLHLPFFEINSRRR